MTGLYPRHLAGPVLASLAILAGLLGTAGDHVAPALAQVGSIDTVAIDMDPTGQFVGVANTRAPSSLGSIENCAEVAINDVIDADEDVTINMVLADITVDAIPPSPPDGGLVGFSYSFNFVNGGVVVNAKDNAWLIADLDLTAFDLSDATSDAVTPWNAAMADISGLNETGPGVLTRLELEGVGAGLHALTLSGVSVLDQITNTPYSVGSVNSAQLAVDETCPLPPTPADIEVTSVTVTAPASGTAGTSFPVTADVELSNLSGVDDVNVDTEITLNLPPDCAVTGGDPNPDTEQDTTVSQAAPVNLPQRSWDITCTDPSDHDFTTTAVASIDDIAVSSDSNSTNNSLTSDADTTAVSAEADLEVLSVSLSSPTEGTVNTQFSVTATVTVHNIGPFDPANADVSATLSPPPDCSVDGQTEGQAVQKTTQDTPIPFAGTDVDVTWSVTCSQKSNHDFSVEAGDATVAVNQTHVTDSNGANDSNSTPGSVSISTFAEADVEVTSVTVTAPATEAIDTNFDVTVEATVHNNGPFGPVEVFPSVNLNLPDDCTASAVPASSSFSLDSGADEVIGGAFTISCTDPSTHVFSADVSVEFNELHVLDPNGGNNSKSEVASTAVTAPADLEVLSVTVDAPDIGQIGVPFNVKVTAALHNNGSVTPVNTDATIDLTVPGDCTRSPDSSQVQTDVPLVTSITVNADETWLVTCSQLGPHNFDGSGSLSLNQLHVSDPDGTNNDKQGQDTTNVEEAGEKADLKVNGVSVDSPPTADTGTPFDVTVTATLHNNGPFQPANADTTIDLAVPGDCVRDPNSSQVVQDTSLDVNANTPAEATWELTCDEPSTHAFDASASVALDQQDVTDPDDTNNDGVGQGPTNVLATADVKVSSLTVTAPDTVFADTPFDIDVSASLHNNGPFSPVNVDTILDLAIPIDCAKTPVGPLTADDQSLAASTPMQLNQTWSVTCSQLGSHDLGASASVSLDQLHVNDDTPGNDSGLALDSTNVEAAPEPDHDVAIQNLLVSGASPINLSDTLGAIRIVRADLVNLSDHEELVTIGFDVRGAPEGCLVTDQLTIPGQTTFILDVGETKIVEYRVDHVCHSPATPDVYVEEVRLCIDHEIVIIIVPGDEPLDALDDNLATDIYNIVIGPPGPGGDPDPPDPPETLPLLENGELECPDLVDVEKTAITVSSLAELDVDQPAQVTVRSVLHNNGPISPVNVIDHVTAEAPPDCTADPPSYDIPAALPLSVDVAIDSTFTLECSSPSFHTFTFSDNIEIDEEEAGDPIPGNNTASVELTATVLATADVKIDSVSVNAPSAAAANVAFPVSTDVTLHNNGPYGPVNADTSVTLNLPSDCSTTDPNPQTIDNTSLAASVPETVQATWSLTCTDSSNHGFTVSALAVLDEDVHTTDPDTENNDGDGQDTTGIEASADLKANSLLVIAPTTVGIDTPFTVSVQATLHNNGPFGPANADASLDLDIPSDCTKSPAGLQTEDDVTLAVSSSVQVTKSWSVTCSQPSDHTFTGSASVVLDELHVADSDSQNNSGQGQHSTAVTANADPKVSAVTVDLPGAATTGAPFTVSVEATLHNNGPFSPIIADASLDLSVPADCTKDPADAQAANDLTLPVSSAVQVTKSWSVTCSDPSNHTFTGSASVTLDDDVHVGDSDSQNNFGQGQNSTIVGTEADVKVDAVSVSGPATANVNSLFTVSVEATLHNNGPFGPVNADVSLDLDIPEDCSKSPAGPQTEDDVTLAVSTSVQVTKSWSVTCSQPSDHTFTGSASLTVDELHVSDPDDGNDSGQGQDTTIVSAEADVKATAVSVSGPASAKTNSPFTVTASATIHNNGPLGPVNTDLSIALSVPADCTKSPDTVQLEGDVSVPVSSPVQVAKSWTVTCSEHSDHSFAADAFLTLDQLHVSDPASGNELDSGQTTVPVFVDSDLKASSVLVTAPTTVEIDTLFTVSAQATLHNNGPFGPTNADASLDLDIPSDCTKSPAGPQTQDDVTLALSSSVQVTASWSVTCTLPSTHVFSVDASVTVDQLHIADSNNTNDSASAQASTTVTAKADPKLISLTAPDDLPDIPGTQIIVTAGAPAQPPFSPSPILPRARPFQTTETLHNNGPYGPVDVIITISVNDGREDPCDVSPDGQETLVSLAVNSTVEEVDDWFVIWTHQQFLKPPFSCEVEFNKTLDLDVQHVSEIDTENNTAQLVVTFVRDADGDKVPDNFEGIVDNCQDIPNPNQSDTDGDGVGDICDQLLLAVSPVVRGPGALPPTGSGAAMGPLGGLPWLAPYVAGALVALSAVFFVLSRSTGRRKT